MGVASLPYVVPCYDIETHTGQRANGAAGQNVKLLHSRTKTKVSSSLVTSLRYFYHSDSEQTPQGIQENGFEDQISHGSSNTLKRRLGSQ